MLSTLSFDDGQYNFYLGDFVLAFLDASIESIGPAIGMKTIAINHPAFELKFQVLLLTSVIKPMIKKIKLIKVNKDHKRRPKSGVYNSILLFLLACAQTTYSNKVQ